MSPLRLHCPELAPGSNALSVEESHHAIASLRARSGDEVVLFDGAGREGVGRIARVDRRQLFVEVTSVSTHPFDVARRMTLAVAMPKAHRQGYLIEKCTELGVAAIWPIIAERSVARPAGRAVEKWSQRAIEAAKQSGRRWVPAVGRPMQFADSVERVGEFEAVGLTDIDQSGQSLADFFSGRPESSTILIWVGPEGGWTDMERQSAFEAGAQKVRLGATVLRTETAAVAVCALASVM